MIKFVFMNGFDNYEIFIINAVKDGQGVVVRNNIVNRIYYPLFKLHNKWSINKVIEMPFKNIWFHAYLDESLLKWDDLIYFIFYESCYLSYSKSYLKYLRRKYPKSKLCFFFHNPVDSYNLPKISHFRNNYDSIITFFKDDKRKYGFLQTGTMPYLLPKPMPAIETKYDLFFIGSDKGRIEFLISIYDRLSSEGLDCLFYIVGVEEKKKQPRPGIVYSDNLIPYMEVLKMVQRSRCVLEVLKNEYMYASIREQEAMQYHKKLLTTNSDVINEAFFNSQIIQVLTEPKRIDCAFFRKEVDEKIYPKNIGAFGSFKDFLLKNIQ